MAVNQVGSLTTFLADTVIDPVPVNSNFTTLKDSLNSLITGSNEIAGGLTVGGSLTIASGGLTVTAGGITITAGGLDLTTDNITNVGTIGATGNITTSEELRSTGGGETGKFLTGGAGATVFAFSGANFDIRAGDGMQSSQ
ncbi:hypothetical protein LCGC14_1949440, partial [marine sediment metagenome]